MDGGQWETQQWAVDPHPTMINDMCLSSWMSQNFHLAPSDPGIKGI